MPTIAVTIVDQTVAVTQVGEIGPTGATGATGTVSAAGDGTAGAPGIAFASDTNTGLFRPGTDILAASTGGTERARIDASGLLGIGTIAPQTRLHAHQTVSGGRGCTLFLQNDGGTDGSETAIYMGYGFAETLPFAGNIRVRQIGFPSGIYGADFNIEQRTGAASWATSFFIQRTTGNVGIGTDAPTVKLDIAGAIRASGAIRTSSGAGGGNFGLSYTTANAGSRSWAIYNDYVAYGDFAVLQSSTQSGATDVARLYINEIGKVGIGTAAPLAKLHVAGQNLAGAEPTYRGDIVIDQVGPSVSSNGGLEFKVDNASSGYGARIKSAFDGGSGYDLIFQNRNNSAAWSTRMIVNVDGHILPGADNTQNFGSGSFRWATIFAGTGTINTSDERYKILREGGDLSDAEYRAWSAVRAIVYRDKDSFERKGDAARLHIGYSWQSIQAAFEAEGLDAGRYGLWCEDALQAPVEKTRTATRPVEGQTETIPVLDDEGQPVFEEVQETEEVEQPFEEVRIIDGAPVLVKGVRTVAQPVFDSVQIKDEDGEPIFDTPQPIEDPETGELIEGDPIPRMAPVPRMISRAKTETVPVMEEVEETFTEMEPTGETRGALRYSQCSVIEAAWLRRELASVSARVAALENA